MTIKIPHMPTNQTSGAVHTSAAVSGNTTWVATVADDSYERTDGRAIFRRIAAGSFLVPALALSQTQGLAEPLNALGEVWRTVLDREVQKPSMSPASVRLLGEHGVQRFYKFLRYANGWDSGRGKALDSRSLSTLNSFFSVVSRFPSSISLFMTTDGHLQIAWDNPDGAVELDFLPDELVAYIEADDRELVLPANGAGLRSMAVQLGLA